MKSGLIKMEETKSLFTVAEEAELIPLLNEGKVILFLGAGFSTEAKNKYNKTIPTATKLAEQMNQVLVANGARGFDGNNIYDLKHVSESFYRFYKDSPKAIDHFFKVNLTIDRSCIPSYYNNLKKVNWHGIYTTNYDDLLEAIYESSVLGEISYKKSSFKRNNSDLPKDDDFNIVFLNGDFNSNARIEEPNNVIVTDLICSTTDFATSKIPEIWNYFIDKFRQYPIIILGSQLNEDSFYSKLGELINKTNIQISNRPKSYIINTAISDQKYVELKESYNLHHKVATTKIFLEWIVNKTELTNPRIKSLVENSLILNKTSNNYIEFTKEYWDNLKGKKSKEDLIKYYTNINSSPLLLPYVVAEEFYIEPTEEIVIKSFSSIDESVRVKLDTLFPKETGNHNCIIWINANGGTGKSTLLQHIGKKYFEKYHILYFKEITETKPILPLYSNDNIPVIILLDNYGKQLERLKHFSQVLNEIYFKRGYCLITTERHLRDKMLELDTINEIDENFSEVINGTFNHSSVFYEKIFDKIIQIVDNENKLSIEEKDSLKARLADNSKATTAERIIDFLISVKHSNLGFQFSFDWEDWEKLCKENSTLGIYSNLYSIVAAFNNYNITPPIKYCIDLLGINDSNLISTYSLFSESHFDFPISIQKDKCFALRNPNLAEWYIKEKDNSGLLTKKYFKDALDNCKSNEQMYILRNTHRNHEILKDKDLKLLVPKSETLLSLFKEYISTNPHDPDNAKNKMETVIININNGDIEEAKKILYEMIADNSNELHARNKLANILIKEQKYQEAEPIVNYLAQMDPTNNYTIKLRIAVLKHSANEINVIKELLKDIPKDSIANIKYLYAKLAKAFRKLGKFLEAEEYCNKLIELNPSDYAAMNTLAMIYWKRRKFTEAEELLLKSIDIQPYNSHNYNVLGQLFYQLYDETGDIAFKYKASNIFLKGLRINKEHIPLRTEFAKFLMTYCNKLCFAKSILQYNIQKEPNHFQSYVELGILFQKQLLFIKAKEILEQGREHIFNGVMKNDHIPMIVILGNSYLELKEYDKAEESFRKTIEIKPENWESHIGLAKALFKQKKSIEYNNEYQKILNEINDIIILCNFANWLKGNGEIDDGERIILKAKSVNSGKQNPYINTIYAGIILEKILYRKHLDSLESLYLIRECDKICSESLKVNPDSEQTLHILYRLYLFLRDETKENPYLRNMYSKKYKKYLGKLFLFNRRNVYVFEGVSQHLKTTRRYRLAIAFIKQYGDINHNPHLYVGQLSIFFGFLENKKEVDLLKEIASQKKIKIPNIRSFKNIELVSQNDIGFLVDNKIKFEDKIYNISEINTNINNTAMYLSKQSKMGIQVFFGLYKVNGNIVANCIEPYFEIIPEDASALTLLELDPKSTIQLS